MRARAGLAGIAIVALLLAASPVAAPPSLGDPSRRRVIVQAPGAYATAAAAVAAMGGTVGAALPIVSGFAAEVPGDAVARLRDIAGVRAVTDDVALVPTKKPGAPPPAPPKSVYRVAVGAEALAEQGLTGAGVRVALVDTGVTETGDLAGKVVPVADPNEAPTALPGSTVDCVNFSGEATCDDTFGHGTFLAGLIAGSGAASEGRFAGVAPGADIVSVKVGGADGSADVSKVLAGIQWVVSFADDYGIRVLNLSLGTDSTAPPSVDPLNLAVQRAWMAGITVVVSAGNFGPGPRTRPDGTPYGTVTKPGDDPYVLTVGSVDDMETTTVADDRLPAFSSWGPTFEGAAKPDVVAPGARLVSLRAPGSTIDQFPGIVDATYRRGSGTSMSAAVVSGLVAQLLQARSDWQPDDVKARLIDGATGVASDDSRAVGAGLVNGPATLASTAAPSPPSGPPPTGLGLLDVSRGSNKVLTCVSALLGCVLLTGEQTAQGNPWAGAEYATSTWTSTSWYLSQWVADPNGRNWQTSTWPSGRNWQGTGWQGSSWYGSRNDKRSYGKAGNGSGSYGAWG